MKLTRVRQPLGPAGAPGIPTPVRASLSVPFAYNGEKPGTVLCDKTFAEVVLKPLESWAKKYSFGLEHLGVYNPRMARHPDGSTIKPEHWSTHSWATVIDWKGIVTKEGKRMDTNQMRDGAPAKLDEVLDAIKDAVKERGLHLELIVEPTWIHVGYKPKKR